jgi:hypothetical protein
MVHENEVWEGVAVESSENHKLDYTLNQVHFSFYLFPDYPDHNNPELANTFKVWESLRKIFNIVGGIGERGLEQNGLFTCHKPFCARKVACIGLCRNNVAMWVIDPLKFSTEFNQHSSFAHEPMHDVMHQLGELSTMLVMLESQV